VRQLSVNAAFEMTRMELTTTSTSTDYLYVRAQFLVSDSTSP